MIMLPLPHVVLLLSHARRCHGVRDCYRPDFSTAAAFLISLPTSSGSPTRRRRRVEVPTIHQHNQAAPTETFASTTRLHMNREYAENCVLHNNVLCRRRILQTLPMYWLGSGWIQRRDKASAETVGDTNHPFVYSKDWTGTTLLLETLEEAVQTATQNGQRCWPMARWPDQILRRPASPVDDRWYGTTTLKQACSLLHATAIEAGAVGLAAQQSGVDARIVYLEIPQTFSSSSSSVVMVNPHIVQRSAEEEMKVWQEHCLVLPPTFTATVLRDAWVDVEYWDWRGTLHTVRLVGEVARAAQHELDHDRGILTLDHVGMDELENDVMRRIEEQGHEVRMQLAYSRAVDVRFESVKR